jgi:hypothetical protein
MLLVIQLLEKELERQNLLIMANKIEKQKYKDLPGYKGPPLIENSFPNMVQLRDQIEDAIALLKAHK